MQESTSQLIDYVPFSLRKTERTHRIPESAQHCDRGILPPYVSLSCSSNQKLGPHPKARIWSPITHQPGGPVDKPVAEISKRLGIEPEQVLLAWTKAKGAVILSWANCAHSVPFRWFIMSFRTSSKEYRLKRYLAVGDIDLSPADIEAIDVAGRQYWSSPTYELDTFVSLDHCHAKAELESLCTL